MLWYILFRLLSSFALDWRQISSNIIYFYPVQFKLRTIFNQVDMIISKVFFVDDVYLRKIIDGDLDFNVCLFVFLGEQSNNISDLS